MNTRKIVTNILAMIVATLALILCSPIMTSAKTVKTTQYYKKAPKVGLGKTHVMLKVNTQKDNEGFFKFKAPKTGLYKFTFSNYHSNGKLTEGKDIQFGGVEFYKYDKKQKQISSFRVKIGKYYDYFLYVCTKELVEKYPNDGGLFCSLPKRDTTIKIKKGQTIYIGTYFSTAKSTFDVNINKVAKRKTKS